MVEYVVSTLVRNEKMYNFVKSNNFSIWFGTIWIIVNYMVYKGLLKYCKTERADKLRQKNHMTFRK